MDTDVSTAPPANPFADALLAKVTVPVDARVVDLACGLGRPALTIAARRPDVSVLGVDIAAAVIAQAAAAGPGNTTFRVMDLDDLDLPDGYADAVVSLFGVLQVADPATSVREMARILRPGGSFGLAAYDDLADHTLMAVTAPVLAEFTGADLTPDYRTADLPTATALLRDAGISTVDSEMFRTTIPFPSFGALWQMTSSPQMFGRVVGTLDDTATATAQKGLRAAMTRYADPRTGGYTVPMSCRLFWGHRDTE